MEGLLRVGAAVPQLHLGNVAENVREIAALMAQAAQEQAGLVVFPELCLTGYTCGDLFFQKPLLCAVEAGLQQLMEDCPVGITAVVGAPIEVEGALYNCGVVLTHGSLLGVVPKLFLPNYQEFYEKRWFTDGFALTRDSLCLCGQEVPVGQGLLFTGTDGAVFGVELCEDLWTPLPPSTFLTLNGAEVVVNLSASNELIAKRAYRRELVRQQSSRCLCGYVYASAGPGESTTDLVFSGHSLVAQCGSLLAESQKPLAEGYLLTADLDLDRIRADRRRHTGFADARRHYAGNQPVRRVKTPALGLPEETAPRLKVRPYPFIPSDTAARQERCGQIFDMQAEALARRLRITGGSVTVGISGGLDSTLALLVACRAMDRMQLPRTNIIGVTMPCFGTTDHTYQNALTLMTTLGITQREIPIHEAVRLHFRDIGHAETDHSVTYENAQARERTQVLMDVANQTGGIVLGTGDLSEIALGWCTYNADHMSMYGVNSGVPKTLVRWVVQTAADNEAFAESREVLLSILDTPISPELLPPDEQGNIAQQTEDLVGPYALHDFFLYYMVRYGLRPRKIFQLAQLAFQGEYDDDTLRKWLRNFYHRFFTQQFKRNCMPDGVKIGSIALSPRGDWRMPSDAQRALWLAECDAL